MFKSFLDTITFKEYRNKMAAARRYDNYLFLKEKIRETHFAGKGGIVLNKDSIGNRKITFPELCASFMPPMYFILKNQFNDLVLVWREDLMAEEIGTPKGVTPPTQQEAKSQLKAVVEANIPATKAAENLVAQPKASSDDSGESAQ